MDKATFFSSLGFTEYESKTLASLIKLKKASPKEISIESGVPQNKLYNIIKKLEKEGILATIPSEQKYRLINFKTFMENKIKSKEKELKAMKALSKDIETLQDTEEEFSFFIIRGQKAIMNKLAEHNSTVKKEILGVQRNWKLWGAGLRAMDKSIKNGAKVKLIGVIDEKTEPKVKEWKKLGCKIKAYNKKFGENPLRFTIFDNKEARVTLGKPEIKDPKDYITIWTKSPALVRMLKNQFYQMWKESVPF